MTKITKIHYSNGNITQAREAMETAFQKYSTHVGPKDVNLMLEVLLAQQDYLQCIQVLLDHGGVKLLPEVSDNY